MVDEIDHLLSSFPYAGRMVEQILFKGMHSQKIRVKKSHMAGFVICFLLLFIWYVAFERGINTLIVMIYGTGIIGFINVEFFIPVWRTPRLSSK